MILLSIISPPLSCAHRRGRPRHIPEAPKRFGTREFLNPPIKRIFTTGERLRRSILFSVLYQSLFETGLFTTKEGSTAVSAVLRLPLNSTNPTHLNHGIQRLTQAGRLCSYPKVQKLSPFGMRGAIRVAESRRRWAGVIS